MVRAQVSGADRRRPVAVVVGGLVLVLCLVAARAEALPDWWAQRSSRTSLDVVTGFTIRLYVIAKGIFCAASLWLQAGRGSERQEGPGARSSDAPPS